MRGVLVGGVRMTTCGRSRVKYSFTSGYDDSSPRVIGWRLYFAIVLNVDVVANAKSSNCWVSSTVMRLMPPGRPWAEKTHMAANIVQRKCR